MYSLLFLLPRSSPENARMTLLRGIFLKNKPANSLYDGIYQSSFSRHAAGPMAAASCPVACGNVPILPCRCSANSLVSKVLANSIIL